MKAKSVGLLMLALLFALSSTGCAQQAEQTPVAEEVVITPIPVEETPVPTPTPLPPKPAIEGIEMLQGAMAELGMDIDLEKNYTTEELIALVVKLLGKENSAVKNNYQHPYDGVSPEYEPYIGYAYATWLLTGIPANQLNPTEEADDTLFTAILLRALGYKDYGEEADFTPDSMHTLSKELGLGEEDSPYPVRGDDVAALLWAALNSNPKGDDSTLLEELKDDGVFSSRAVRRAKKVAVGEDPDYVEPSSSSSSSKREDEPSAASTSGSSSSGGHSGGGSSGGSSSGGGSSGGGSSGGGSSGGGNSGGGNSGGDSGGGNAGGGGAGGENETPSVPFG